MTLEVPVFTIENCYPMFLGPGVKADLYGIFPYRVVGDKILYSTFPILVHSDRAPNIHFTLAEYMDGVTGNADDGIYSVFQDFTKRQHKTYCEFEDTTAHSTNTDFIVCLSDKDKEPERLCYIIKNILNPWGIGAFIPKGEASYFFPPFPINKNDFIFKGNKKYGNELKQVPFTIEIVKKMLFNDNQEIDDFDGYSITSLFYLEYPLPKVIIPRPNIKNLRERFIYFRIMLNNPPQFDKNKYRNIEIKNYQPGENNNELINNTPKYQWIYVYVQNPSKDARIIVGDIYGEMISLISPNIPKNLKIEIRLDRGTNSAQYFSVLDNQAMYIVGQNVETEIVVFS